MLFAIPRYLTRLSGARRSLSPRLLPGLAFRLCTPVTSMPTKTDVPARFARLVTSQVLPKWHLYLLFACAPLRPAAVSRPARLRGSHRPGPGLNERGSRLWAPARLRLAREPRGCPLTGFLDLLGRCANRPGRRAPSTCGDAEVRGVPLLVCCRRGGGVAGRPSRPRHAGAPAPRPLPPRYRPFGSRAVGRRGGSRGRRCAPAVGGRGDHLSPGLRRLGGPARPPCASRGRMPRGAFARGRFWYRRGGAAWAGAAQPLAVGCLRLGTLPWLALCPASLSG